MYAVVSTGGKQYRLTQGEVLRVEKLDAEEGATVELDKVLMIADGDKLNIGAPLIEGGKVSVIRCCQVTWSRQKSRDHEIQASQTPPETNRSPSVLY
jgi:ribosomal protein L21